MRIKLPTSWNAVTLGEWQAVRKLLKSEADPYLVECAIISTLSGADMNDIQSLTREGHGKCMQALAFLKHPIGGKLRDRRTFRAQRPLPSGGSSRPIWT